MSEGEETFALHCRIDQLPKPVREHKFHPDRRWRFDFAWPDMMIACEIEGGTWIQGRHNRGSSIEKDYEKYNAAALLGWRVFRFSTQMVRNGTAIRVIGEAINNA